MIGASNPRIGCNTQGIYIMIHGKVAIVNECNITNMCSIKGSKMKNKSQGASNTSSMIHNIHAHGFGFLEREGYHLESMSLCVLHNAEAQASMMYSRRDRR